MSLYTRTHTQTHTQYHQGPVIETKETHFSPVNMKSWMSLCLVSHPKLGICQRCLHYSYLSSVTHQAQWNGGHHLHNVSSRLSTKTVIGNLAICILQDASVWLQQAEWLGGFLTRLTVLHMRHPATTLSTAGIFHTLKYLGSIVRTASGQRVLFSVLYWWMQAKTKIFFLGIP